jgi:hypothetical protein
MRIGNVIRDPDGSLWIVSNINDYGPTPTVSAVSFHHEQVVATQRLDDHTRMETCVECTDEDCEDCHGIGSFPRDIVGWKHSEVLARNVQDFLLAGVKRTFGITK